MFDFDEVIDRRGTHSAKWDMMEKLYGVSPVDGISMWVADMDFRAPPPVAEALRKAVDHGVFGYFGDDSEYRGAVAAWMKTRHGWEIEHDWLTTSHGLVAGVALCLHAFSEKGDGVVVFTPVYHAFHKILRANERRIVESELREVDGRYEMDLDALGRQLDGSEKIVLLCSPHNPGGKVWSREELRALADFCAEHDLLLVSDEIHHDLLMPGAPAHVATSLAAPEHRDRLVVLAAATKTFNIAGALTGSIIIENPELRRRFQAAHAACGGSPNRMGMLMATAAYQGGAPWLDALRVYLDGNRELFDAGIAGIPGLRSMRLDSTYLAWVDFSGTGMEREEFTARVQKKARIAANLGPSFGQGGESWLRFNFATRRSLVEEAVERLGEAFADLQ